jgi:quinol-cytochrome oxidoreductase complex cytochrome b subunit
MGLWMHQVLWITNLKHAMKFYLYLFYRFSDYYKYRSGTDSWIHAFILTGAIFVIHLITILAFIQTLLGNNLVNSIRIDNAYIDRFVLFPLLISPVYIVLFIYYRNNRMRIKGLLKDFRMETFEERKKKGSLILYYLIGSALLLVLSIISPVFTC